MSEHSQSVVKIDLLLDGCKIITSGINDLSSIQNISDPQLKKSTELFDELERKFKSLLERLQCLLKSHNRNEEINILFTGSISTGKSKIINAIIKKDILKSAAGHTTQTFIKIAKNKNNKKSIILPGKNVKSFKTSKEMRKYLEDKTIYKNSNTNNTDEVTILLPAKKKSLLMDNVFIYDSPGFGKLENSTAIIKEKYNIADILVFVMTHNITMESMLIFDELKQFAAIIPTIILINKWEETDKDDEDDVEMMMKDIETQISNRITSERQSDSTIPFFYISAKEEMSVISTKTRLVNLAKSSLNKKKLQRSKNFQSFQKTLLELIELAPKETQNQFSKNYQQVITEVNKMKKHFDSERNILIEHLRILEQRFDDIHEKLLALLNEIEIRIKEIPSKIEIIKNEQMRKPDQSSFINKISEIYKTFDGIYAKCNNVMSLFMDFLPNKKKAIEACCFKLESKKRRITELNNQCQRNWSKAIATGTAAAGAAGLGVAAVAAGMGAVAVAPFAIAAGLGYCAWNCWGKSKENKNEIKMDIKFLIEKSDKYGEDLIDAYDFLKVAIKDSGIKNDCETSFEFLKRFLANIMENKKKIDEAFY